MDGHPSPETHQSSPEALFVRGAAELNHILALQQQWNIDEVFQPYVHLLPDTTDPMQTLLTMRHIYGYKAEEILSVLIEAHAKPLDTLRQKIGTVVIGSLAADDPLQLSGSHALVTEIEDLALPDDWELERADKTRLEHRHDVAEDIVCYLSEGVRRHTDHRSPVYMVEQATQLAELTDYCAHIKERIAGFEAIEDWTSHIKEKGEAWARNLKQLLHDDEEGFSQALKIADRPLPIPHADEPLPLRLPPRNYTEEQALEEDCRAAQAEIVDAALWAQARLQQHTDWLHFVAQLDQWRDELDSSPVPRRVDWLQHRSFVPVIRPDDDLLPSDSTYIYDYGDY
jgi:hypothetical protein